MSEQEVPPERRRRLTHRLVGAAVLVALAAILIPAVLDFRGDDGSTITGTNIPERPEGIRVEEISLIPQRDSGTESTGQKAEAPPLSTPEEIEQEVDTGGAEEISARESETRSGVREETGTPPEHRGYAVQVGSFSSEENATMLRDRLRNEGYSAFLDRVTIDDRTVLRVLVGPDARREQSERQRDLLASEMDLSGVVVGYE